MNTSHRRLGAAIVIAFVLATTAGAVFLTRWIVTSAVLPIFVDEYAQRPELENWANPAQAAAEVANRVAGFTGLITLIVWLVACAVIVWATRRSSQQLDSKRRRGSVVSPDRNAAIAGDVTAP